MKEPQHTSRARRVRLSSHALVASRGTAGKAVTERTFDLIDNAETFLRDAADQALKGTERSWVLAVVNLAVALELMLKALLRKEHWALLFEDVRTASVQALQTGEFKTVTFHEALRRCQHIGGVTLDPGDIAYLKSLNTLRNQALHYEPKRNVEQLRAVVAGGLNVFNHLYSKQLRQRGRLPAEVSKQLLKFDKYVSERMRRLQSRLKKARRPHFRYCLDCSQAALVVVVDGALQCLFCEAKTGALAFAKRMSESGVRPCSECESGWMSFVMLTNDVAGDVCVLCGQSPPFQSAECTECGELFANYYGISICQNCFNAKVNKDD